MSKIVFRVDERHEEVILEDLKGIRGIDLESCSKGLIVWLNPLKASLREVVDRIFKILISREIGDGVIYFNNYREFHDIKSVKDSYRDLLKGVLIAPDTSI